MPRIHGRAGVAYLARGAGDAASPLAYCSDWTISFAAARVRLTPMGDPNHAYIAGEIEVSGTLSGWYDPGTAQSYIAAADALPRSFYLYPAVSNPGQYFFGTVLPDFGGSGGVAGAVAVAATWSAAGPLQRASFTPLVFGTVLDQAGNIITDQAGGALS